MATKRQKYMMLFLGIIIIIIVICLCFLWPQNKEISSNEAYKIAIKEVGKSEQEIISKKIKENEAKKIYEITINDKEYSYEFAIDVQSGNILKQDKKQYIGEEEAKKIALESADLKEKNVLAMTINLENRNDTMTYIVTFLHKNHKYTYEINALTKEFINNNIERN